MRGAGTEFSRAKNAIDAYKFNVNRILAKYKEKSASIREEAKKFKDEGGYVAKYLPEVKEEARKEIETARKDLNKVLEAGRETLEKQLYSVMSAVPAGAFTDLLRFFSDFGIVPNKMEVNTLLDASRGNALAIRALNGYLEKSGSRFRVAATPYEDFAADLDRLARMQQELWTGLEYPKEAGEIFNGTARTMYRADGTAFQAGYVWDTPSRLLATRAFDDLADKLEKAGDVWAAEVIPKVMENGNGGIKDSDPALPPIEEDKIKDLKDSAEAFAKRSGAEKAAEDEKARKALQAYTQH